MEKINIAEFDIDFEGLIKKQGDLSQSIAKGKEELKQLRAETDGLTSANSEQLKTYAKLDADVKALNKEYNTNKTVLAEVGTGVKGLTDAMNKEVKTIDGARKNNKELLKVRNQVNANTKEGRKAIEEINAKIDDNNGFIKENVSSLEKQKINIGNYASALDQLDPRLGAFVRGIGESINVVKGSTSSLQAFRVALISTGIGAIVVALGSLIAAFASTQEGLDKINSLLAPVTGAFQALIGVVQDIALNVFSQLGDRFTVASNTILKGINNIRIGWNNITGDQEVANQLIEENAKLTTESEQAQERLNVKTQAFSNILSGANERLKEGAETQKEIERLSIAIEQAQIRATVPLAKANNELRKYKQEAEDVSRTEQERLDSLQKAVEAQQFITQTEQNIQDLMIQRKNLQNSLNDTSRQDEQEYQDLIAQRYELETSGIENLTTLQNLRNTIVAQQAAKQTKAVEEQLKLEQKAAEERIRLAKEEQDRIQAEKDARKALEFENELIRLEEEGASRFAIRMTQLEQDFELEKEMLHRKIQAGEESEQALTNAERRYAMQRMQISNEETQAKIDGAQQVLQASIQTFGQQSAIGKLAAVTDATINTYKAANLAIATIPPPFGQILAGILVAQGLRNVSKIAGVSLPGFAKGTKRILGDGSETSDSVPALLSRNERVVDAANNRKIGFDMDNSTLAMAAQMYRNFRGSISFTDRNIVSAIQENTNALRSKKASQTVINVSEGHRVTNQSKYLS